MSERIMVGTEAWWGEHDLSSERPDFCVITDEDEAAFIGSWLTGFGFIGVRFPKASTRLATEAELMKLRTKRLRINGWDVGSLEDYEPGKGAASKPAKRDYGLDLSAADDTDPADDEIAMREARARREIHRAERGSGA